MDGHRFETREVHAGVEDHPFGAVNQPIFASTTYEYDSTREQGSRYRYERMAGPTRDELEAVVADLEGGRFASAFASGMAAIDAVLSILDPGDHVVTGQNLYAETHDLMTDVYPRYGIEVDQVDVRDVPAVTEAIRPSTALVYLETPSNPRLDVADIERIAAEVDDATVAVDNTFASPFLQRPLELGADVAIESMTKYVTGHSDALVGAVATDDPGIADRLETIQYTRGAIPGPFKCYLAIRGSRTLSRRVAAQSATAGEAARFLADDDRVAVVHYPGLPAHPNHAVAARQMDDFGGMVSVELAGGLDAAAAFVEAFEVFTLAESLGGVESLAEVPALMTHRDVPPAAREAAGITDGLVRLSVGIEHEDDVIGDLRAGLVAAGDA